MEQIQQSQWKYNEHGEWLLTFDKQLQYENNYIKNKLQGIDITISELQEKGQTKAVKIGNNVITPKGIGRLLKIDKNTQIATVKIIRNNEEKEHDF